MPIKPTDITLTTYVDTNNTLGSQSAFTDDVLLEGLSFPEVTFDTGASFAAVDRFEVLSGRERINADWGADDTATDGDGTPLDDANTDDASADDAMLEALNSNSLSELIDGEDAADFQFKVGFSGTISDNDTESDDTPEIVLFERGGNDAFTIKLMVGGTFDDPEYSEPLTVDSADWWNTEQSIDTVEIDGPQEIHAAGFDLNDFGLSAGETVFGMEVTADQGDGPDLNGLFLAAEDPHDLSRVQGDEDDEEQSETNFDFDVDVKNAWSNGWDNGEKSSFGTTGGARVAIEIDPEGASSFDLELETAGDAFTFDHIWVGGANQRVEKDVGSDKLTASTPDSNGNEFWTPVLDDDLSFNIIINTQDDDALEHIFNDDLDALETLIEGSLSGSVEIFS